MSEARDTATTNQGPEYTVVVLVNDDTEINRAVTDLRELGISGEDLTVILKRTDPDVPEPLPEGTRYIVVPNDNRGLVIPVGFAIIFAIAGLIFAFTTPGIGTLIFVFFIAVAAILAVGAFSQVGVDPILIEMEVPPEDSGLWNDEFERGKVLIFASAADRRTLRPIWEALRRQGADFYVVKRRLEPQAVGGAVLHRAGEEEEAIQARVAGAQEA